MVDKTTPAPAADEAPQQSVVVPAPYAAPRVGGLAIAGIVVGSLIVLGAAFGGGLFLGVHLTESRGPIGYSHIGQPGSQFPREGRIGGQGGERNGFPFPANPSFPRPSATPNP